MNGADKDDALTLELLGAIAQREDVTQRDLAQRSGVALGLANSYLKRCIQTGLVKVQQVPPNRYLYYLTPKGFSEKSRLVARYLAHSFAFYRQASAACDAALLACERRGHQRVGLCGVSDLAEIALLKGKDRNLAIAGIFDPASDRGSFMERPVWAELASATNICDGFILTELNQPAERYRTLVAAVGEDRVIVPEVLAPFTGLESQAG